MTDFTPVLHIQEVAPTQSSKEATINTAITILEASVNSFIDIDASAGDVTVTVDDWTRYYFHNVTGHTVTRTITVPDTERFCVIKNNGTATITIHIAGSAGDDLSILASKTVLISCDGTDVRTISSGVGALVDLSDVVIPSPVDGDVLTYDSGTGKWVSQAPGGGGSTVSLKTNDYTFALGDRSTLVRFDKPIAVTATVPPHSSVAFNVGDKIDATQTGDGQLTIAPGAGVTLDYPFDLAPKTRLQHSSLSLICVDTDEWLIVGDLDS